jgi:hypothetical protein
MGAAKAPRPGAASLDVVRSIMRALAGGGLLVAALALGCGARTGLSSGPPLDAGMDALVDAATDAATDAPVDAPIDSGVCREYRTEVIAPKVDVLFVIDNSGSMVEEQESLVAAFRGMAAALATGDLDEDGVPDFPAATDLHVAVVTSDLGAFDATDEGDGLRPVPCGADGVLRGDDGVLEQVCGGTERFLSHADGDSIDAFSEGFACLARVGTDGCGFEQPLEAALKALTPASSELRFAGDSRGHGARENAGFLRPDSVLAIVVLTDEDDGSVGSSSFVDAITEEEIVLGDSWYHPVERYRAGFDGFHDDPERIVFAVIAGLPADLATDPLDADAVLADPRMQRVYDPAESVWLVPSCVSPGRSRASPPRRLVELAGSMGDRAVVRSICQEDYRSALSVITERVGEAIRHVYCVE